MFDQKSSYAMNKMDPDAIIYTDADRRIIRLTREDFDTEADFLKWKAWSDENYHEEEKRDHVQSNHAISMGDVPESADAADGPEPILDQRTEEQNLEKLAAETILFMKDRLTEKQFRRVWMYCVEGMTEREIAEAERTSQSRISECINLALRKIRRLLRVRQNAPDIRGRF